MICPSCGNETQGTETSPGTVSSTCPPCNIKLTGTGHHADAYDTDARGNLIAGDLLPPHDRQPGEVDKPRRRKA